MVIGVGLDSFVEELTFLGDADIGASIAKMIGVRIFHVNPLNGNRLYSSSLINATSQDIRDIAAELIEEKVFNVQF